MQFYGSFSLGLARTCSFTAVTEITLGAAMSWWLLVAHCGFWQLQVTPGGASGGDGSLVGLGGSWWVLASDGSS